MLIVLVVLRLAPIGLGQLLLDDELTSYLVATGHAAEYGHSAIPTLAWVPAHEWQRYLQIEEGSSPASVVTDLLDTDIHPPLYFLLLRGWTQLFGSSYFAGKLLSWLLDIACLAMLVFTGQRLFSSRGLGLLTGLIWLVSPVAILGGAMIRQYSLLTLEVIVFTLLLGQLLLGENAHAQARRLVLALLLTAFVGLLTHLLFITVLAAGVMAVVLTNKQRRHMAILVPLSAMLAALFLFLTVPNSFGLNHYIQGKLSSFDFQSDLVTTFAQRSLMLLLPLAVPLAAYAAALLRARMQHQPRPRILIDGSNTTLRFLLVMLLVPCALHGAMVLTGLFYPYSLSNHHLLYLTPLVALAATGLLREMPKTNAGTLAVIGVLAGLLVISAVRIGQWFPDIRHALDLQQLADYDLIVVDNVQKPRFFNYMDPQSTVFAADQQELFEQAEAWIPRLVAEGGLYVSLVKNGPHARGDGAGRERILGLIEQSGSLRLIGNWRQRSAFVSLYEVGE